jgi:hypothetical protein
LRPKQPRVTLLHRKNFTQSRECALDRQSYRRRLWAFNANFGHRREQRADEAGTRLGTRRVDVALKFKNFKARAGQTARQARRLLGTEKRAVPDGEQLGIAKRKRNGNSSRKHAASKITWFHRKRAMARFVTRRCLLDIVSRVMLCGTRDLSIARGLNERIRPARHPMTFGFLEVVEGDWTGCRLIGDNFVPLQMSVYTQNALFVHLQACLVNLKTRYSHM